MSYGMKEFAAIPRLNALSILLGEEDLPETGVLYGAVPYLQLEEDDMILTLCYEQEGASIASQELVRDYQSHRNRGEDESVFLLHIRSDLPIKADMDDEMAKRLCDSFNAMTYLTHASITEKPFPEYPFGAENNRCFCLHGAMPERGAMPEDKHFALTLSLFFEEVRSFRDLLV